MFRQLEAVWIYFIFTLFRKVWGLWWFYVVYPFKGYADNYVFNYCIENGKDLPRLKERPITPTRDGYVIAPYHGTEKGGFIFRQNTNWFMYQFIYWVVWGWLDADANYDTFDKGRLEILIEENNLPMFIIRNLRNTLDDMPLYGNTFDLGDVRNGVNSSFKGWASILWNGRNTAYNFSYMQFESMNQYFYYDYKYFQFGYKWVWSKAPEGQKGASYRLVFGFKRLEKGQA